MVTVTTTVNSDEFLYLKQLLCMIAVIRLNRCLKINEEEVNYSELCEEARNSVLNLELGFEIPTMVLRVDRSIIDFEEVVEALEEYKGHDVRILNIKQKQLQPADVFHKPRKEDLFNLYKQVFNEKNKLFVDQRKSIAKVLNICEDLFNCVNSYIQSDTGAVTISEAVMAVNVLEGMDYTFSLAEAGENVFIEPNEEEEVND